jgi:hypothetical protein
MPITMPNSLELIDTSPVVFGETCAQENLGGIAARPPPCVVFHRCQEGLAAGCATHVKIGAQRGEEQ